MFGDKKHWTKYISIDQLLQCREWHQLFIFSIHPKVMVSSSLSASTAFPFGQKWWVLLRRNNNHWPGPKEVCIYQARAPRLSMAPPGCMATTSQVHPTWLRIYLFLWDYQWIFETTTYDIYSSYGLKANVTWWCWLICVGHFHIKEILNIWQIHQTIVWHRSGIMKTNCN